MQLKLVVADAKLTALVIKRKPLSESLSALGPYLRSIAKLKEGIVLKFNTPKPGKCVEREVTPEFKTELRKEVLKKAQELVKEQDLDKLGKALVSIGGTESYFPIKEIITVEIDAKLPNSARDLTTELVRMTESKAPARLREFAVSKAKKLHLVKTFTKALGKKAEYIAQVDKDLNAWKALTSFRSKVSKDDLTREHKSQLNDSVHDRSMIMILSTKDGVL